jgi:hypothetical protein
VPELAKRLHAERTRDEDVRRQTLAGICRCAGEEAHDLGNLLLAITFCLRQLRGRQHTGELEEMVERASEEAEQGVEAARGLMQATRMLLQMARSELQ